MSDAITAALLKLGMGRYGSVTTPGWARILASMSDEAHAGYQGQRAFAACRKQGARARAGRGGGKSFGMLGRYHSVSAANANQGALFIALSAERARDILFPAVWKFNELYGTHIEEKRGDGVFEWPNGFRVHYRGCKDINDVNKRRGVPWAAAGWDECFVAGTPVYPVGRVLATSSRVAPSMLVTIDGITSTGDHPYLTPKGWKRAIEINPGDLLCVRRSDPSKDRLSSTDLLEGVSLDAIAREVHVHRAASNVCKNQGPVEEVWNSDACCDEEPQAICARRQRPWAYVAGISTERSHWLDDACDSENRNECPLGPQGLSGYVQVGPGVRIDDVGRRDRRRISHAAETESSGCEESALASWKRVDCVEVHERGGIGRYDKVCPDGRVYNLTTESGVYFAGNALVHNCASINQDLLQVDIHDAVAPRLMDLDGRWFVGGTPGPIPKGYWYELSSGDDPLQPLFCWDARHNPHMPNVLQYFFETLQRMQGVPDRKKWPPHCKTLLDLINDPSCWKLLPATFVREYLGQWVLDLRALIYKLTPKNSYTEFPIRPDYWTIGCDLGSHSDEHPDLDHAAVSVAASHSSLPYIWCPESVKLSNVTVDSLAAYLCEKLVQYPEASVHIDSASAGKIIETTFQKMGIPIQAAVKGPKLRRIQLVQSAIATGNFQAHQSRCMDLRAEATALVWDEKRENHSEKCDDDAWDSLLMAAVPHFGEYRPEPRGASEGSPEWQREQEMREYEEALQQAIDESGQLDCLPPWAQPWRQAA